MIVMQVTFCSRFFTENFKSDTVACFVTALIFSYSEHYMHKHLEMSFQENDSSYNTEEMFDHV